MLIELKWYNKRQGSKYLLQWGNCIVEHHQCHAIKHWSNLCTVLLKFNVSDGMLVTSFSTSDSHNVPV